MRYNINWLLKYQLFCALFCRWNRATGQIRYSVPEELQPGAFIGNIATDLGFDLKQLSARRLRVAPSPRKQYVEVNLENGILFVIERIDREQLCGPSNDCILSLNVVLENPLGLYQVEVEIIDVNDNSPSFPESHMRLEISEMMAPGARFPLEAANDPDIGTNSVQTYQLLPNAYFILDVQERSGKGKLPVLTLQSPLDREKLTSLQLTLLAEDGGVPTKSGKAEITIIVQDANDNAPVFSRSVYTVSLPETAPLRSLIITVNATDLDDGPNGEITYSISSHSSKNIPELFGVDSKTGEIRLKGHLDYEQSNFFEINIQAVDNGPYAVPQHCDVLVNVIDVNDNAPDMKLTSTLSAVPEDTSVGTIVALLAVDDKDSGQNGQVQCKISSQLPFKLDSSVENFYRLLIRQSLDRETTSRYDITITCTDAGYPNLTSTETIRLDVTDVNDNVPRFLQAVHTAHVMENNVIGASIYSLTALDSDIGRNARLNYSILPSQVQNFSSDSYISINSRSGVIYAQKSFDYEKFKKIKIYVQVRDSGTPPLLSNTSVDVVVLDQNDNAPVILYPLPHYGSTVMEKISRFAEPGHLVVKVSATDADAGQNARLFYQIVQTTHRNLFTISADTGEIWTIRDITNKDASKQRLVIVVRDNGTPSLSATVTILLSVEGGEMMSSATSLSEKDYSAPDLNFSLVIALGATSLIFLIILVILAFKVHKTRNGVGCRYSSLNTCCCLKSSNSLNGIQKASTSLQIPPNYVEVFGGDPLSQSFRYKSCSTLQSVKRELAIPQTCGLSTDKHCSLRKFVGKENAGMTKPEECNYNVNTEVRGS